MFVGPQLDAYGFRRFTGRYGFFAKIITTVVIVGGEHFQKRFFGGR